MRPQGRRRRRVRRPALLLLLAVAGVTALLEASRRRAGRLRVAEWFALDEATMSPNATRVAPPASLAGALLLVEGDNEEQAEEEQEEERVASANASLAEVGAEILPAPPAPALLGRALSRRPCPPVPSAGPRSGLPAPPACFDVNLMFLKGPKTGSSTMGGLARRIAARFDVNCAHCNQRRALRAPEPRVLCNHMHIGAIRYAERIATIDTFRWGLVRDPAARCLSAFYMHEATRRGTEPSVEAIQAFALSGLCSDELWRYYDLDNAESRGRLDWLGVTERFDESVLLLGFMLDLSLGDLLYVPAKNSSDLAQDIYGGVGRKVHKVVPTVPLAAQPPALQAFFRGEDFAALNRRDAWLHQRAVDTLDEGARRVGLERFGAQLARFRRHLAAAARRCRVYNAKGQRAATTRCYWHDNGCGFPCLDQYATSNGLWVPLSESGPG